MDLQQILNGFLFFEKTYNSLPDIENVEKNRLNFLAKSAAFTDIDDALDWFELDYDINPGTPLSQYEIDLLENWLIAKRDDSPIPEKLDNLIDTDINSKIPELLPWDTILSEKSPTLYTIKNLGLWDSVKKAMPNFIKKDGFEPINSLYVSTPFIKGLKNVKKSGKWDQIKTGLDKVIPALFAGKINERWMHLHYWKNSSPTIGAHIVDGRGYQCGLRVIDNGNNQLELYMIDNGHGISDG